MHDWLGLTPRLNPLWLDINWLRENHVRLYYFGLGFIQLKIDESHRLHFYTKELPSITDDIHNHRYSFSSAVLAGEITNHYWNVEEGNTHIAKNESCNPEIGAPALNTLCRAELIRTASYHKGCTYHVDDSVFHQVETEHCITLLRRSDYTKEFAQIITLVGKTSTCPFSKQVPDQDLWQIVGAMLKEMNHD